MANQESSKAVLKALYSQIELIYKEFSEIRCQAEGIVNHSQMPDAALHLNDVLQATEDATNIIMDAVTAIGTLVDSAGIAFEAKEAISEQVGKVYEACSFQDITGQRIKKVLQHLGTLENQLLRLSKTAQAHKMTAHLSADPLLNGPQLTAVAPNQEDIDNMFEKKEG